MVDLAQGAKYSSQLCEALPVQWNNAQITDNEFTYFNKHTVDHTIEPITDVTVDAPGGFRPGLPVLFHITTDQTERIDTIVVQFLNSNTALVILRAQIVGVSLGLSVKTTGDWTDTFQMTNPFLGQSVLLKLMIVYDTTVKVYLAETKVYTLDLGIAYAGEYDQVRVKSTFSKCSRIFFKFVEIIDK